MLTSINDAIALNAPPNSDDWRTERQRGVGASDVPIILGMSSWMEPRTLYYQKRGELAAEQPSQFTRFGHLLEPAIVGAFAQDTGLKVAQYPAPLFRRRDNPRHLATPDGIIDDRQGLECKLTNRFSPIWTPPFDEVPDSVFTQCQWQMYVMGWERVWVELLVDAFESHTLPVDRSDDLIGELIPAVDGFLEAVDSGEEPDWLDGPDLDVVRRRFTGFSGEVVDLSPEAAEAWAESAELRKQAKQMEERAGRLRATVLEEIGNADAGELPGGGFIRRKRVDRAAYTVEASSYIDARAVKKLK